MKGEFRQDRRLGRLAVGATAMAAGLAGALVSVPSGADPGLIQNSELSAQVGALGDGLGQAIAVSGTFMVIGAPGQASGAGAVYVFNLSGGHWHQSAVLTASDGVAGDGFGSAVAIDSGTVAVGAPDAASGAGRVYVFAKQTATSWPQSAELTASDGAGGDALGTSVSFSGTSVVVAGAPGHDAGTGAVYAFAHGTSWSQSAELTSSDGVSGDAFGSSVSGTSTSAVVGAPGHASAGGAVYVFGYARATATWSQAAELVSTDDAPGDHFGAAVSASGPSTVVAGAPGHDSSVGAAYVFTKATTWSQAAELTPSVTAGDDVGSSVSVSGTTAVVGAPGTSSSQGSAYVYADSGGWIREAQLATWDSAAGDGLGSAVAATAASAFIGAPGHDSRVGAAYVFSRNGTTWGKAGPPTGPVERWGAYLGGESGARSAAPTAPSNLTDVVAVDAGNSSGYALECSGGVSRCATDGTVWAWGDNDNGQLGDGTLTASQSAAVQVQVPVPAGVGIVSIGEARNEGFAIDATGQAYAWGFDGQGSLCLPSGSSVPQPIPGMTDAAAVQGAGDYSLWLLANGTVEACGQNANGELGDGSTRNSSTPQAVVGLSNVVAISAGGRSAGALDASGRVWTWGDNQEGELGVGTSISQSTVPVQVALPAPATEVSVGGDIAGDGHTLVLLDDGSIWGWGNDVSDQIGDHTGATNVFTPLAVFVPAGVTFTTVVAGGDYSMALDSTGAVWTWGSGYTGQIGDGVLANATYPVKVDVGVVQISSTANNAVDLHG